MVNKKGWVRIVEASIGVVLVLGTLIFLNSRQEAPEEKDLSIKLNALLDELAQNTTIRGLVGSNENAAEEQIRAYLSDRFHNSALKYDFNICELGEDCLIERETENNIYSAERIFALNSDNLNAKKVKLYIWRK